MTGLVDETHDPKRASWVASANGHAEFPIQNLPVGMFSPGGGAPRGGVAIGDEILDLKAALAAELFSGAAEQAAATAAGATLNPLMALGSAPRAALRKRLSALLAADSAERGKIEPLAGQLLHRAVDCTLHLPAAVGDFTDFFAGIQHATNAGMRRRPEAPLRPFLSKNFGTTVSPWVITAEALAPFRLAQPPRPAGDPRPLPYLWDDGDQRSGAFDVELEAFLQSAAMREKKLPPQRLSVSNTRHLYWTLAQMVAHHTASGCNLAPGDLFGSGTISAPDASGYGSVRELSQDGEQPIALASGETRKFVEDGDEVILRAHARRAGCISIGFGDCSGRIS
ncbi:MAG: fumarylacetoacetate hydrolase family protein [Betaproteobacteria bacterium]|nr:fumarylacetoacetate hydrolase family protein [Betaproteobacteria bacterium]